MGVSPAPRAQVGKPALQFLLIRIVYTSRVFFFLPIDPFTTFPITGLSVVSLFSPSLQSFLTQLLELLAHQLLSLGGFGDFLLGTFDQIEHLFNSCPQFRVLS